MPFRDLAKIFTTDPEEELLVSYCLLPSLSTNIFHIVGQLIGSVEGDKPVSAF